MTQRLGLCGWFAHGNVGNDLLLSVIATRTHPEAVFSTRSGVAEGLQRGMSLSSMSGQGAWTCC